MKIVFINLVVLALLASCSETDDDQATAELLIGTWRNASNNNTIQFDREQNYCITLGKNTQAWMKYQLDKSTNAHKIYIFDNKVKVECSYQFIGDNKLKLTQILPYGESLVGTYYRQPKQLKEQ